MITFAQLVFEPTLIEGNTRATLKLDNGYEFDIIRKLKERVYKLKGFEMINGKKKYIMDYFKEVGYDGTFPSFSNKDDLITFINELDQLEEEE